MKLTSDIQERRGHTIVSSAEITRNIMFKQDYINNVDVILLLHGYCLEPRPCAHKVLLLCFPALKASISRADATAILSQIESSSRKHGFEFVRTCGSSGMTCAQADRDLLCALRHCQTSLPRKVGACKITRHNQFAYLITYRCVKAPPEDWVVSFKYFIPRCGGSFVMQPGLVAGHLFLNKFSYLREDDSRQHHTLTQ